MANLKILQPKSLPKRFKRYPKKSISLTRDEFSSAKKPNNNEITRVVPSSLYIRLEKINIFEYDGQYALYGSIISTLKESHENLKLPIRINSRLVKKCPDCPYKTLYHNVYNSHQRVAHKKLLEEYRYFCYKCSYSTDLKQKLSIHMVSHNTLKPMECPYCGKMFKAKHSVTGHIYRMHNESIKYHYCDTCSFKCKSSQGLISHKERTHIPDSDRKEEYLCQLCPFTTSKKWTLQFHMGSRHKKNFSCSKCSFITPLADSFEKHHCKLYECRDCDYKTHRITIFKIHCTRHRKREELPLLKCPFCRFVTTSPSSLSSHRTDHRHNINVECPECHRSMKKRSLTLHIKTKHATEQVGWLTCPSCDYKTTNGTNLQRHIENRHTDKSKLETLKCEKCDFKTKSKGSLYMHAKHGHSNMTYSCKKCHYVTVHRGSFMQHHQIHIKRKPIACGKCSKTFLTKPNLKMHIKRMHEKGKTYICQLCPKDFQKECKTTADLRRHMLKHKAKSELETFKCHNCPYEAKVKAELAKHIRLVHINNKDKYHICTKCYYRARHKESLEKHIKQMHKRSKKGQKCTRN